MEWLFDVFAAIPLCSSTQQSLPTETLFKLAFIPFEVADLGHNGASLPTPFVIRLTNVGYQRKAGVAGIRVLLFRFIKAYRALVRSAQRT